MNFFLVVKKIEVVGNAWYFYENLSNSIVMPTQCCFFFCENELQRWTSSLVLNKMIQSAKIYVKKYLLSFRRPRLFAKTLPLLFPSLFRAMLRCSLSTVWKGEISEEPFFPWFHANCRSKDFHHSTVKRNPKLQHLLFTFRVSKSYLNYVAEFERCIL